jgi:hypothetical protein
MIPLNMPEKSGAPDARAIPRQRGMATRKTTMAAITSNFKTLFL